MPTPRALSGLSASNRRCTSSAGSEADGSSRTRTSACTVRARAIATRDFSVRVRSRTRVVGASGQSTWASAELGGGLDRAPVDVTAPARIAGGERDVFRDRHPFDEPEVLVDEGDRLVFAEAGWTVPVAFAAVLDRALRRLDDSSERLDQGRFACAVLAEQRQDFTGMKVERDAAERRDASEPLHHVPKSDQGRSACLERRGHFHSKSREVSLGLCYR